MVTGADDYVSFVAGKHELKRETVGIADTALSPRLFGYQRYLVDWSLHTGKAALFADCGLGKGPMALEWARHVAAETRRPTLVLAPLAVAQQFVREGAKFNVDVGYAREQAEVAAHPPVVVTNYERLGKFDPDTFGGVVLDESSIIKSFTGKVKQQIFAAFKRSPFKLACTATPAPNDHMELGQHSEFLDVLTSHEMIARWFINDSASFGTYRLKGHATADFWAWVSSWARCVGVPSDVGFPDDGFALPELRVHRHIVGADHIDGRGDQLFRLPDLSATAVHKEKRRSAGARAADVARLVRAERDEAWLIWCETDYEEAALLAALPDAVAVNGSMALEEKESKLIGFSTGSVRYLISKPRIAGFGMNWQHCARVAFVGPTFSYEQYYQAIRRCWRFGQARPVECHVAMAETEVGVWDVMMRKAAEHEAMKREMFAAARRAVVHRDNKPVKYAPRVARPLVPWIQGEAE
jgi:hypothetical protein